MSFHSGLSFIIGLIVALLPHRILFGVMGTGYNPFVHEYIRLYGCLSLGKDGSVVVAPFRFKHLAQELVGLFFQQRGLKTLVCRDLSARLLHWFTLYKQP